PKFPKKVYKVVKALYGLHQAPRAWYATFYTFMVQSGYRRGLIDKTLFIKKDKKDIMMKEDGIFISQDKCFAEILKKFGFMTVKTASTPIETKKPLVKDVKDADVDVHLYRSMIGSLMYLTASRPNIMYTICACSRFQVTPKTLHLHAMKRIFRYLKGHLKLGLWYPRESAFDLEAYLNNDYAGANIDRKSITGVKNPVFHSKTKHTEIRHHFIRDDYEKKLIQVLKIHTDDNAADLLTKAFDVSKFNFLIGLVSPKMRSLGACIQTRGKKAKTGLNIKEGNFNKLDDLVGEGADYVVNEGRSVDKIKVLNAEAEGVSTVGETLSTATLAVSIASIQPVLVLLKLLYSYWV
nr:hypothetical protein [Tanacetum cinerariifolium]